VQWGEPVWDGTTVPWRLPAVSLDTSEAAYGSGWHYCADLAIALRVAGLWPDGWPSVPARIEASADALRRGRKWRTSQLTIVRRGTQAEIAEGIHALSAGFSRHQDQMAAEQLAWHEALGRPQHDPAAVEAGLREALDARGLTSQMTIVRYDTARAAWDARAAWTALTITYVRLQGWLEGEPDQYSRGLREAYACGLEVAVPVALGVLGWCATRDAETAV